MSEHNERHIASLVEAVERLVHDVIHGVGPLRKSAFARFPLLFTLLGAFGTATVFFGFNGILNRIPYVVEHPFNVLLAGLLVLGITGTLYKRLS